MRRFIALGMCLAAVAAFSLFCPAGAAQQAARPVDWTQMTPGILDLAFDWADAVSREAEVVDERESVYAPRQAEADTLLRRLQRKISWNDPEEIPADAAVYKAVVDFSSEVGVCRIMRDVSGYRNCSMELFEKGQAATSRLKEIQKLYKAAQAAQAAQIKKQ